MASAGIELDRVRHSTPVMRAPNPWRMHVERGTRMAPPGSPYAWFWQALVALLIYVSSGAGYFNGQDYTDYLTHGYVSAITRPQDIDPPSLVGTIASLLSLAVLVTHVPRRISLVMGAFLAVNGWFVISAVWSNVLLLTVVQACKAIVYVNALEQALRRLTYEQFVGAVVVTSIAICLASLYLGLIDPSFRMSLGADGWRGLFAHKNRLASFCLFDICLIFPALYLRVHKFRVITALVLLAMCLGLSQGKTGIGLTIAFVMTVVASRFWASRLERQQRAMLIYTVVFWIAAALFVEAAAGLVYAGAVTFSGRTTLWLWYMDDLGGQFVQGMGGMTAPADPNFMGRASLSSAILSPDSSYILMIYNQGLIGLVLFFAAIASFWYSILRCFNEYSAFCIIGISIFVMYGAMESDGRLAIAFADLALIAQMRVSNLCQCPPVTFRRTASGRAG